MKAQLKKEPETFKPVTLEITFETEREMKFFKQFIGNIYMEDAAIKANLSTAPDSIRDFSVRDSDMVTKPIYDAMP